MPTLLEKAKNGKAHRKQSFSQEDIELAIGWLKEEIGIRQYSLALNISNGNAPYIHIARALKSAFEHGTITIKK